MLCIMLLNGLEGTDDTLIDRMMIRVVEVLWESLSPVLVGGHMNPNCLKLSLFGCFGPKMDLNYSKLDLFESFGSHLALC